MRLISHFIFSFFSNLIALMIAANLIAGFEISDNFVNLSIAAAVFMLLNTFLKPILKMLLSPLIILTLGLFILIINGSMLALLDILSEGVTINGNEPLIYGTLLITGVNLLLHFSAKHLAK